MEKVQIKTQDEVTIIGNWSQASGDQAVLLLHMMPATKESWNELIKQLNDRGVSCLAIDQRGHGESTNGGQLNYHNFSPQQQQAKILDVRAAADFIKSKGKTLEAVIGASIGANLALVYQVEAKVPKSVFISGGLDFFDIKTESAASALSGSQSLLLIAGAQDPRVGGDPASIIATLYRAAPIPENQKEKAVVDSVSHGTDLLADHPGLMANIVDFISK